MRENLPPNSMTPVRALKSAPRCALWGRRWSDGRSADPSSTTLYGDTVYVVASETGCDGGAVGARRGTEGERQGMSTSALLAQEQTHELVRLDAEGSRDSHQWLEGRAQLATLDPTDVVPVQPRLEAEPLLRVAAFQAQPTEGCTERSEIALWRDGGFWHATGRSQAAASQSTPFLVSPDKGSSGRHADPTCKRPAEAGRLRKLGKNGADRAPGFAPPIVAPPEGIEPFPSQLRTRKPASTGGGYRRMRGAPDARPEKRTRGAHRVNSPCRDPHTFTPCPARARTPLTVTKGGASAPYLSRKGSE